MNNLGIYYSAIEDYDNMKQYYLLTIEHGDFDGINNLRIHHQNIKCYEVAIKYYSLSTDRDYNSSVNINMCTDKVTDVKLLVASKKYSDIDNIKRLNNLFASKIRQFEKICTEAARLCVVTAHSEYRIDASY